MKNLSTKITLAAMTVLSMMSLAAAGQPLSTPVPEPGTFGMFAGAAAAAIILTRIMKKK